MERKDFLKTACGLCGLAFVPGIIAGCNKDSTTVLTPPANFTVDLSSSTYAGLNNIGGSQIVNNILIIHTSSGFVALQANCTHEGCTVQYQGGNNILCPCHTAYFDTNGNVVSGPPPSALHKYTINQSGTVLTIT